MRPYTICHMMASLDGRIDCDMTEKIEDGDEYYDALAQLNCPSTLMGRVTMQMHYADKKTFVAQDKTPGGKETVHIAKKTDAYIVAIDTKGTLVWPENEFDGQSLLVICCEDCPKEYTDRLTEQGISWMATGKDSIDLPRAMELLSSEFGIERLSVTGGGHINAAFLQAGLLDEVSMMFAPGIDGRAGMTAAFDGIADKDYPPTKLKFQSVVKIGPSTIWLRYKV